MIYIVFFCKNRDEEILIYIDFVVKNRDEKILIYIVFVKDEIISKNEEFDVSPLAIVYSGKKYLYWGNLNNEIV